MFKCFYIAPHDKQQYHNYLRVGNVKCVYFLPSRRSRKTSFGNALETTTLCPIKKSWLDVNLCSNGFVDHQQSCNAFFVMFLNKT